MSLCRNIRRGDTSTELSGVGEWSPAARALAITPSQKGREPGRPRERHDCTEGQRRAALKAPIRFSRSDVGMERGTPRLGEDEDYVFGELLNMSTEERQSLIDQQVIY